MIIFLPRNLNMCNILSYMNPTSVLFCKRHQYSGFVKRMRFIYDFLHDLSSCQSPNKYEKAGIFQSLQFYRVAYCSVWAFIVIDDGFTGAGIGCGEEEEDEEDRRTIIWFFGHIG